MIPTDTEQLYYSWLEENHPEEFRRRVEEEDYYYSLEKQWRVSLPTERDFLLAFPEGVKELLKTLKEERVFLMADSREAKNLMVTDYQNEAAYQAVIDSNDQRLIEVNKEITKLEWYVKPKSQRTELDIAKAKEFPITNLIEFKRKVAICIWHDDRKPSMNYFPSTNKVWCFACQNGGDAIDVAMKLWNMDIKDAVTKLTN